MKKIKFVQQGKLTKNGWLSIVAFLLVAVIALSVALGLVVKSGKEQKSMEEVSAGGGMVLPEETEGDGISLTSTLIPKEQYEEYGIMPIAESAQQLTATVTPTDALVYMDWSVSWKEGTSGKWGDGKTVAEYVTVTPTSAGALTANVQCLKAFGEQIIVTASVRGNETVNATCTVDYVNIPSVAFYFGSESSEFYVNSDFVPRYISRVSNSEAPGKSKLFPKYSYNGDYTIQDTYTCTSFSYALTSTVVDGLKTFISSKSPSSNVKSAINGLTTGKQSVVVSEGIPDFQFLTTTLKTLFGGTSLISSELSELNGLLSGYMYQNWRASSIEFTATFTGTYTSFTCTLVASFNASYFNSASTVQLGESSLVFHE